MRTRNADAPKSATTVKKTPVAKKSATKTPPKPTEPAAESSATPKSGEMKSVYTTKAKQVKSATSTATNSPAPESKPEPPAVKEANAPADAVQVTPETKATSGAKKTRKVIRKVMVRRKTSAKAVSGNTPKSGEAEQTKAEESSKKEGVQDVESVNQEEEITVNVEVSAKKEETAVENVEGSTKEDQNVGNVEEHMKKEEAASDAQSLAENDAISSKEEDTVVTDIVESSENQDTIMAKEAAEEEKETKMAEDKVEPNNEPVNMEKDVNEGLEVEDSPPKEDVTHGDDKMEEHIDREILEEFGDEKLAEDNVVDHGEKVEALEEEEEPAAEALEEEEEEEPAAEALEAEHAELTALAQERKIKKELEVFVGGLDRDATEEDVKKVFANVGEVVEVRLHKSSSTNKNKGYAFVKFATKEQASRALAEMKNPIIHGKRCGTAPSEDNNTLFLGNICNSWTKEAIKQKLKDYAIEGVESITLVANPQHEGLSRGFAFVEFSCHADAMLAYKRLQKPDVIFGHSERTAKVAFAEPLREPDPEVMAQVKSVFVDGLPQYWDEDRVRAQFKGYGEIERITLARNMSTAKRKDFGFVDFTTHEAAIACIDDINTRELGDGNKKTKVKARLSNPQPKIQVVKGGMCGGFRIGRAIGGTFSKNGRGFGRGGHSFNRSDFQGSRAFYQRGRGQPGMGYANEHDLDTPYASFQGRQNFGRGGRWGSFRDSHHAPGGSNVPARVNLDRQRHGATDRGSGRNVPLRGQPFSPEEELNRPFLGRHFEDPYLYDDSAHGMKRPYFDHDPDYVEPSRVRPRLDYSDPAVPLRGSYYRDTFGAGSGLYSRSRDYYGPDYGGGAHSSFYGGHRPYGGGYYY